MLEDYLEKKMDDVFVKLGGVFKYHEHELRGALMRQGGGSGKWILLTRYISLVLYSSRTGTIPDKVACIEAPQTAGQRGSMRQRRRW